MVYLGLHIIVQNQNSHSTVLLQALNKVQHLRMQRSCENTMETRLVSRRQEWSREVNVADCSRERSDFCPKANDTKKSIGKILNISPW